MVWKFIQTSQNEEVRPKSWRINKLWWIKNWTLSGIWNSSIHYLVSKIRICICDTYKIQSTNALIMIWGIIMSGSHHVAFSLQRRKSGNNLPRNHYIHKNVRFFELLKSLLHFSSNMQIIGLLLSMNSATSKCLKIVMELLVLLTR